MLITIHCTFAPGSFANAKTFRLQHYGFLREARQHIVEGGPLLGPDGVPVGMLMVVEQPNLAAARDLITKEPYNANGLFESVQLRSWSHVVPEPHPGFIDEQYELERKARDQEK